jgi:hypothetical protein
MRPVSSRRLFAYLEGEVTLSEASEIEARVADSAAERARLDSHRGMVAALAASDPALDSVDLVAGVRAAAAEPAPEQRPRSRRALAAALVGCLLVAILVPVLLMVRGAPTPEAKDGEFRARSAGGADPDRWVGIKAFYVDAGGESRRLAGRLPPQNKGLLFAYSSTGPDPLPYLMVFAVDEDARVYWFYPAFERRGTDPTSLRLERSGADIELPFKIRHRFSGDRLAIFGLFTRQPLRVSRIERLIRDLERGQRWSVDAPERLPLPGSAQHVQRVRIER